MNGFERHDNVAKVEKFLAQMAARYGENGVPVGEDGRIDENFYKELYSDEEVEKDLQGNRQWEKNWHGDLSAEEIQKKKRLAEGEQLEMLACAMFIKNLGEKFVVVRSSPHDDRINKVDTIILDRETGNLVCAFDEVGDTSGVDYEEKQNLVREKNLNNGASLKYGISVREGNDGKKETVPSEVHHIPLFYLALPSSRIKKGIEEFVADPVQQSEFEKRLFLYFTSTIIAQIDALNLYQKRLDPELRKRLEDFKNVISSLADEQKGK